MQAGFHGALKGDIIRAITIQGIHELSRIREHPGAPQEEFMEAFYELLRERKLEGTQEGTFNVRAETREKWIQHQGK